MRILAVEIAKNTVSERKRAQEILFSFWISVSLLFNNHYYEKRDF